jgi:hypothetical protein
MRVYGIQKNADFSFLLGKTVEQVCLGQYQTQIHLDDANISIECKHTLFVAEGSREIIWERDEFPSEGISKLLGQSLSRVAVEDSGALEFTFSQGDRLSLFDDSEQYESFQITCGVLWIVV